MSAPLILRWNLIPQPLILRWLGPDGRMLDAMGTGIVPQPLAAIIGPRGVGNAAKAQFDIGDGAATEFFLDHNFNDWGVGVWVYRNVSPFFNVIPDIGRVSANRIHLVFNTAPALDEFHVIIMTVGSPV